MSHSADAHGSHKSSDALSKQVATTCERAGFVVRAFSEQDYAELPAFNWDLTHYEECAAVHLIDQSVSLLHVASVLENGTLVYRAKTLFPSPASVMDSPDYHGDAFSVSFGSDAGEPWKGDTKTALEELVAEVLSKHSALTDQLVVADHRNVNAWLEDSKPVRYISVNTGKRYSSATAAVDLVSISNTLAGIIQADSGLVWKISSG